MIPPILPAPVGPILRRGPIPSATGDKDITTTWPSYFCPCGTWFVIPIQNLLPISVPKHMIPVLVCPGCGEARPAIGRRP